MTESIEWDHVAPFYATYTQATFDIPFFLQEATKNSGEVLELMAGTGRVSLPLVRAGVQLTCVDNAPEMLARLRQKQAHEQLSAQVYEMDVRHLALDKQFNLIILPFHSFSELVSPTDRTQALERIYEHLASGGRFICTLHNPPQRLRSIDGQLRLVGTYPESDRQTKLLFWSFSTYDETTHLVHASQFMNSTTATESCKKSACCNSPLSCLDVRNLKHWLPWLASKCWHCTGIILLRRFRMRPVLI